MNNLSNITDEFSYIVRDYPSIIKWFASKLKYLTTKWTDLSVSEPDTLSLSYIAYVYDLVNYLIDNKFIDTTFSNTRSVEFLSNLYQLVGSELKDYNSGILTATVDNKSSPLLLTINKLDILKLKNHPNELFTSIESYEIQPKSSRTIKLVRGTPVYYKINKSDISNGYFVLPDENINRNFIEVDINGNILNKVEDAIFETDSGVYSISQYSSNKTSIRLSPSTFRSVTDSVVVKYVLNDTYPLASNSELVLLNSVSNDYTIYSDTNDDIPEITLNDMKYNYYTVLNEVFTLFNEYYDVSRLINGRIDYLKLRYDNTILFESGTIDYKTGKVDVYFNVIPTGEATISYTYFDGAKFVDSTITKEFTESQNSFILPLPDNEFAYVKELSLIISIDENTIVDNLGNLVLISCPSYVRFKYSTVDNNPITDILSSGTVDYVSGAVEINFNYIPNQIAKISYKSTPDTTIPVEFEIEFTSLINSFILEVPTNREVVSGSLSITIGNNIIEDDGTGTLVSIQTDESYFKSEVVDNLLINKTEDDIKLEMLSVRYINIDAVVYLYSSDVSIDVIDNDIRTNLRKIYAKGTHPPGESIQKISLILNIENSNPNIKYAELNSPLSDVAVGFDQISQIGTINIKYERSGY